MLFVNICVSTIVQEAAPGIEHASGAFTVPIDANTEERTILVNQAVRCSGNLGWVYQGCQTMNHGPHWTQPLSLKLHIASANNSKTDVAGRRRDQGGRQGA
ncbi:hypothetical protein B0H10DRAFT_1947101 [Mycena sp. CBHHK59/15]|nr:hypothetical protein B0H10DRAFT_1947101 [Mycena sp. CBHHK59/15]